MLKIIAFVLALLRFTSSVAQFETDAPYKRFPTLPPINLLQADSTSITKETLRKNQPVIIMYFSPECHHCQRQVEDILRHIDDFKKIQLVFATYRSMEEMTTFYERYGLKKYPNILLGRDTKYFIQPFYKVRNLPYLAVYDKKGVLVTTFEGNVTVDKLLQVTGQH